MVVLSDSVALDALVAIATAAVLMSSAAGAQLDAEPPAVFADVLALTRRAVTSHWLVTRPEWRSAAQRWEQVSAGLAPDARGLEQCWPPLAEARGSIAEAHRLFERARRLGDDAHALHEEHKRLLGDAARRLDVAERCYRAFRQTPSSR